MQRIIILGLGVTGRAVAKYLLMQGEQGVIGIERDLAILERDPEIAYLRVLGLLTYSENEGLDLLANDLLICSPGIHSTHPILQLAIQKNIEVIGEIEFALRNFSNPIIGVTGTNGKTTVTSLITHILNHQGMQAKALGNIGTPLIQHPKEDTSSILVIELSSYQLETFHSQKLDAAVLLNISPDHLDRYPSFEDYAQAKFLIQKRLKPGKPFWICDSVKKDFSAKIPSNSYFYGTSTQSDLFSDGFEVCTDCQRFALPLRAKAHDLENILAAFAICSIFGVSVEGFKEALTSFRKPPHRIEYVGTKNDVLFYDDSKGTNIDAVICAVESLTDNSKTANIILIAGGVDKGAAYTPWRKAFKNRVKSILAIGQAANKISEQLSDQMPVIILDSLEKAIHHAYKSSIKGDLVLLSPGCSSFDMFRDYAHRGEEFQRIVKNLSEINS